MNYRRLGKSGLKVSVISCGFWAMFSGQPDIDMALACLTAAYDAGCNYFDNAVVCLTPGRGRTTGDHRYRRAARR
jgi:aryl-alcohol dehydrogenase-like predicted oxidoreductase